MFFPDRSYLRITEQEFTTLPIDVRFTNLFITLLFLREIKTFCIFFQVLIQCIVSLFVVMYGVMHIAGDFKEIRAVVDLENKSWETLRNLPSFQIFNHRGQILFKEDENKDKDFDLDTFRDRDYD